jgi:hypothetical protein
MKERAINYAKQYFALNNINLIIGDDKYYIDMNSYSLFLEITFDEVKYRASLMLHSELEGINSL